MAKNKLSLILYVFFFQTGLYAQEINRYMVFFTDKVNSEYSIDQPQEFLSQKAIERKNRAVISSEDLPVNSQYINQLKSENIEVLYSTKWKNGVLVEATQQQLDALNLDFIERYELVAPNSRPAIGGRIDGESITNGRQEADFTQNEVLKVPIMHEDGFTGEGIRIAVLDAGFPNVANNIYLKHIFDDARINVTYDFVRFTDNVYAQHPHGARVFSIIASYLEGSFIGPGYGANFDLFITEDADPKSEHRIEEYNWLVAAEKADSAGVDIITTSLGYFEFEDPTMNYQKSDLDGKTAIITQAAEAAFSKGMLVITSSGNEGSSSWGTITFPADGPNVLAVGSVMESTLLKANSSSGGPTEDDRIKPDVMAVGGGATYVNENNELNTGSGTSYAAPQIAGLAAGIWQKYPELSNAELKQLIIDSGDNNDNPNNNYGYGIPSYVRASNIQDGVPTAIINNKSFDFKIYPNPVEGNEVVVEIDRIQNYQLEIINVYGQKIYQSNQLNSEQLIIDVSEFVSGVYIVMVSSNDYSSNLRLLIK